VLQMDLQLFGEVIFHSTSAKQSLDVRKKSWC
jgi:hypothetical protein